MNRSVNSFFNGRTLFLIQEGETCSIATSRPNRQPSSRPSPLTGILVACAESMLPWFWLTNLCAEERIPFILGYALYMRAIHGGAGGLIRRLRINSVDVP